ncbi:MAG: hypothetical protein ACFFAL_04675 [Promethearchaeota archaeon]
MKALARETKNAEDRQIAKQLMKTVLENKCKLLEDEIQLASSLGIRMYKLIKGIYFHEAKRVSVIWEAYTRTRKDTFKWTNIALPSTGFKRKAAKEWITRYQLGLLTH